MENGYQFQSFELLLGDLDLTDSETEALCSILDALFSECSKDEINGLNKLIEGIEERVESNSVRDEADARTNELKFKHIIRACEDIQNSKSSNISDGLNVLRRIIEKHPKFFDVLQKMILDKII